MKTVPQNVVTLAMLSIFLFLILSCSKDSDLLLDAILDDPEVSIEEKNGTQERPADEEGFVIRSFTFSAINDAYLQNDQGHDQSIIRLQEDYRTSYLMFDLSEVNGPITEAILQFSIDSDEGDGNINIHKGGSTDWTEETLTANNAPLLETQLAQINKSYKIGSPEKVVLDANNLESDITTLVMTHNAGNDLAFASKEHPGNKGPKLVVTYKAPEGSPLISQPNPEENTATGPENNTPPQDNTPSDNNTPPQNSTPPEEPNNTASTEGAYFVTTSGSASNNGRSEATAWNIEHAFETAVAGDVVYIKAGNYGNKQLVVDNSGNANNPIKFIGYTNTPGDVVSNQGSTFNYGESLDANKMPLIIGSSFLTGVGLSVPEAFIEIHNFQITDYQFGVISQGKNVIFKNVVTNNNGEQRNNNIQLGRGFQIFGDFTKIENCFSLNSNGEAINLKGANNCLVKDTKVYSDNLKNMTGYYIAVTFGGNNNIIEGCTLYRDPSGDQNLPHQGHGFIMKDQATNNIVRNCKTYNTGIEVNYSGVHSNTFENIEINGNFSTYRTQFSSCIGINNGAHHNIFKNITIKDARYAVVMVDFDDGYVGPGGDRDENQGGNDNQFINLIVEKANSVLFFNSKEVGFQATSVNNIFRNCTFKNVESVPFSTKMMTSGTKFIDSSFENFSSSILKNTHGNSSALPLDFTNCTFKSVNFQEP